MKKSVRKRSFVTRDPSDWGSITRVKGTTQETKYYPIGVC